jgi:ankyrin repeat protein
LENSSLNLFELSFNGQSQTVRDLLMRHKAYVDVCDSRGLTALHFATYNVHINVVNVLLDSGANVNQLSDDGLTPLAIAFLLYYGNNPQQTINIALEHSDPVLLVSRSIPVVETSRSITKDRLLEQSRTTINSSRHLISRRSIIEEGKLQSSVDVMKINDIEKKSKISIEFIQ